MVMEHLILMNSLKQQLLDILIENLARNRLLNLKSYLLLQMLMEMVILLNKNYKISLRISLESMLIQSWAQLMLITMVN